MQIKIMQANATTSIRSMARFSAVRRGGFIQEFRLIVTPSRSVLDFHLSLISWIVKTCHNGPILVQAGNGDCFTKLAVYGSRKLRPFARSEFRQERPLMHF